MEQSNQYFADLILPVPIPAFFTYRIPEELKHTVFIGSRVLAEFGKRKILTGVVYKLHTTPPAAFFAKDIIDILEDTPLLNSIQLKFIQWMGEYYMCTVGEVFNAALPSGLKLSSNSKMQLNPASPTEEDGYLTEKESALLQILRSKETLDYEEAARLTSVKNIHPVIKSLIRKGSILIFEEVKEKYKPRYLQRIRLHNEYVVSDKKMEELFQQLEKKPKQLELLLHYLQKIPLNHIAQENVMGVEKNAIAKKDNATLLNALIKKGIFEQFSVIIPRYVQANEAVGDITLTSEQEKAVAEIKNFYKDKDVVLLHGITGSGKTEIFIKLIQEALAGGSQVLYLLPEIALTTQMVTRLHKIFGTSMGIYHSRFSANERVDIWHGIANGKISFIVGVRSSIFLPFHNLGLVVIDEEHDASYKQYDPAPRYHARDSAIMLAHLHHAKVLLGSATPSIESYHLAVIGKYGLVEINARYGNSNLPQITVVDMKIEKRNKTLRNDFSKVLYDAIVENKNKEKQTLLFQNRRGYAPFLTCQVCGFVFKCDNCAVSLTYHLQRKELSCHYCGHKEKPPSHCPSCSSANIRTKGYGTEKIEEDLHLFFPDYRIQRMDHDTTRKKDGYQNIIDNFESFKTDILVGTQMISKGFDFGNVTLVGILDIDRFIHFPDFRSYERTFQLIIQVSGRAGRRETKGNVIIQSTDPAHPLFKKIITHDFKGFFKDEIIEREKFNYPPFSRIIKIITKDSDEEKAKELAEKIASKLKSEIGTSRILGPEAALISRIKNNYLFVVNIKLEREKINFQKVKELIHQIIELFINSKEYYKSQIIIDVDPA